MARKDLLSSIFWTLCGLLIMAGAFTMPVGEPRNPGPGFMPMIVGAMITVLALVLLIRSLRIGPGKGEPIWKEKRRLVKLAATLGALMVYVFVFQVLGFLLTTILLTIFLFKAIGDLSWRISLAGGVATAVGFYLLFKVWLQVQVPAGFLGI